MYEDVKGVARGADKARLASWVSDSSELGYTLRPYPTQPLFAYVLWFANTSFLSLKKEQICETLIIFVMVYHHGTTMANINCISVHYL